MSIVQLKILNFLKNFPLTSPVFYAIINTELPNGGGCFPFKEEVKIFFLPRLREVILMEYITLEELLLIGTFLIAFAQLIINVCNNKKR